MTAKPIDLSACEVVLVPLDAIKFDPDNCNEHPEENLNDIRASLDRFGFVEPVVLTRANRLIAGEGRLLVLRERGNTEVPAVYFDGDEDEAAALGIALNESGRSSRWNTERLTETLRRLQSKSAQLAEATGFSSKQIDKLAAKLRARRTEPELPPLPTEPRAKLGDVWRLGRHRLLCADNSKPGSFATALGDLSAACVITDPPYAIFGSSTGAASEVVDDRMVMPFCLSVMRAAAERVPYFGHVYVFCDWRTYATWWEAARRAKLAPKNFIIWVKPGGGLGSMYGNKWEGVFFLVNEPRQESAWRGKTTGHRMVHRPNVIEAGRPSGADRQHHAAKPVDLLAELIRNSTDPGGVVLDPYTGSGSTLLACETENRTFVGLEIEPKWVDVAVARWEALTGETAELEALEDRPAPAAPAAPASPAAEETPAAAPAKRSRKPAGRSSKPAKRSRKSSKKGGSGE